jgi:Tfp pilus assembly protein PilF
MNAAEKGERYARIFRKAGTFLGKGNIARAAEVLKEGVALARALGDTRMAERFQAEIERAQSGAETLEK